ncbi:hypothetical protein [Nostoc sp. PA-18-2419]|uniref:hypothetical protein n=1 Tax=Nostoc sp. PA-18-2419 TaxID=2575443 RepID=UPI001108D2F7|nr:hypothetical protein [Nostoc sp. PA-18-2419]
MTDPQPLTPLKELLTQASALIVKIGEHPDYRIVASEACPLNPNLADAHKAIVYLLWEVAPPSLEVEEIEVNHD